MAADTRKGEWEKAFDTFEQLRAGNMVDEAVINAAISALAVPGDWQRAWALVAGASFPPGSLECASSASLSVHCEADSTDCVSISHDDNRINQNHRFDDDYTDGNSDDAKATTDMLIILIGGQNINGKRPGRAEILQYALNACGTDIRGGRLSSCDMQPRRKDQRSPYQDLSA